MNNEINIAFCLDDKYFEPTYAQDTLNAVLEGTIKKLDFRYNFYETYFKTKEKVSMSEELWNETQVAKMNICILHYMQSEKPWFYECENPFF